ncbi:ammonium transporter [Panacibacter ginsenosidivorans]|uniref:Ammonium transporter n=1 Tax=Panacibacter ginsenosidivorans TaxID=1813871 RepID=A0A5B8V7V8_9BACT|nr:ammonium transporter [Panacibacter ginsenosidivorans]QEC67577.1 ammonium transporter [Panacibacter ginsenosidivorans]
MKANPFGKILTGFSKKVNRLTKSLILLLFLSCSISSFAQDASGANTGTIKDLGMDSVAATSDTTLNKVVDAVNTIANADGHNKIAINIMWTLLAGFLVMFMQAGFALVETGFTQKKNVAHTMGMNFMVYALGMIGFWICGFALMFGGALNALTLGGAPGVIPNEYTITMFGHSFGIWGTVGFFLNSKVYDVGVYTLFLFQMVFMDTTATIPTGSMAERWSFKSFLIFGLFISMFVYPLYGNWVWGGGWLSQLGVNFGLGHGHVDFAGSSVVHLVGGIAALAGAIVIGPRVGKYGKDGTVNTIPGHNIPMAILGTFILAFGWFGFNPGSTLAGGDLRIGVVAVNTMLAGTGGTLSALLFLYATGKKPDPGMLCNGLLAGLVAITAPCAFVTSLSAVIIGAIAGVLVIVVYNFVDAKLKIDDPVGAFAVHGANGAWGCLALGLFADGSYGDGWNGVTGPVKGLFYGDSGQFFAELIGVVACIIFVFIVMYVFFKVSNKITPIRVKESDEIAGLDIPEMGVHGYID